MKKTICSFIALFAAVMFAWPVIARAEGGKATVFHPLTGARRIVTIGDPRAFAGGYMLETPLVNFESLAQITVRCTPALCPKTPEPLLGYSVVTRYRTTISSSMTSTQTTVPVASIVTFDEHTLTMSDVGGKVYLTIEPGTSREEIVKCTDITSGQWSSCTRGLAFYGTSESAVTANQKAHNAGSIVVMSNVHYVYDSLADLDSEETIGGVKTFSNHPKISSYVAPTSSAQYAPKGYVDAVGAGGFTSANIGDGKTLRANGTSPETVDVATSTATRLESFVIDAYGKFSLNTSTNEKIDKFWNDRYNATSTKESLTIGSTIAVGSNATIGGNATSSGNLIVGTSSFAAPTNTLTVVGNTYLQGSATSSKTADFKQYCVDGADCITGFTGSASGSATRTSAEGDGTVAATGITFKPSLVIGRLTEASEIDFCTIWANSSASLAWSTYNGTALNQECSTQNGPSDSNYWSITAVNNFTDGGFNIVFDKTGSTANTATFSWIAIR